MTQNDTGSTEMEQVRAALYCVGKLLRDGVFETEAEELCALEFILGGEP